MCRPLSRLYEPYPPSSPFECAGFRGAFATDGSRAGPASRGGAGFRAQPVTSIWLGHPGSRRVLAQGLQENAAQRGPLTHSAGPRSPLKVAGDAAQQVDAGGGHASKHASRYGTALRPRERFESHNSSSLTSPGALTLRLPRRYLHFFLLDLTYIINISYMSSRKYIVTAEVV